MKRSILFTMFVILLGSHLQAATIDETTSGTWIDTYGEDGYVLPFYDGPISSWTAPIDKSSDVASLPSYVTDYSYAASSGGATGPYGYKWGSSIAESDTRWGGWGSYSLEDPREDHAARECCTIYYDGDNGMTISLTLAADAPNFKMAVYAFDFGEDHDRSETIATQWQGDSTPFDSAPLDDYWQGKWAVFDVVPNGETQLDIIVTPSMGTLNNETNLMGIMFSAVYIPGDANKDGFVNIADATILAENWQTQGTADWGMGDFNGDKNVDDIDATMLAANWQPSTVGGTASVPEPSAIVLLAAGLIGFLSSIWRKRKR